MYGHLTLLTWFSGKIVDLIPIRGGALNMPPRGSFMQLLDKHRYRIFHLTRRQNNLAVLLYLWHYQQHIQPFYISPGFFSHFFRNQAIDGGCSCTGRYFLNEYGQTCDDHIFSLFHHLAFGMLDFVVRKSRVRIDWELCVMLI